MIAMRIARDGAKRQARKIGFSVRVLAALRCPPGRRDVHLYDERTPGLCYRLMASGAAAFYVYRRINGRPRRVRIGGPELTIEQARRIAGTMTGQAAAGIDPVQARKAARAAGATLGQLLTHFIDTHAKPHKKSWREDEANIERYLSEWKPRRLATITQDDIRGLHARLGVDKGHYSANRVLSLLHSAYAKAGELWGGPNAAHGVQKFREQSRDRFLSADELGRFLTALDDPQTPASARDYFLLLLLTGARKSNVRAMRWADLDLAAATWRIPGEQSKNGQVMLLPLAPEAAALLENRKVTVKGEFVFPSIGRRVKSATGHLDNHYAAWCDVLERAKLKDVRLHDLRRTLGSWLAIGGTSLPIIGKALGHRNTATTAIYARLSIDPVRAGINAATSAMLGNASAPAVTTATK